MKIQNLKIKLVGSDPDISRKLLVSVQMNLDDFHQLIQTAMPWGNSHMHQFHCQSKECWREEEADNELHQVTKQWSIERLLPYTKAKKFHYVYDFRDHWDHLISVSSVEDPKLDEIYPKLLAVYGFCPPEDIGGIRHNYLTLEIINEPEHESHEKTLEWLNEDFDPNVDVFLTLEKRLQNLHSYTKQIDIEQKFDYD